MRKRVILIVAAFIFSMVLVSTAIAESVFQQIYDGIKGWGKASTQKQ